MNDTAIRFRRLADRLDALIAAVPDGAWSNPSPCEGWTAGDVLGHIADTELDFVNRHGFDVPDVTGRPAVDRWVAARRAVQSVLDDPANVDLAFDGYFGPTTFGDTIDQFYSADLVVHTWDIATAVGAGQFIDIDPVEMERVTAGFAPLGDNVRMPGVFGPALAVADDAGAQERFLAFTGRRA